MKILTFSDILETKKTYKFPQRPDYSFKLVDNQILYNSYDHDCQQNEKIRGILSITHNTT